MEHPVVEAAGLRVTFPSRKGPVEALKGLDLRLPKGSLYVLLGPNGAGKTTLMRCITALVRPTAGAIRVFGAEAAAPADRPGRLRRVGVLIENPGTYGRLDSREYLEFFASFYGVADPGARAARIDALCGAFGLALDSKRTAKLSQGNRQKLHLVRSLLHAPELLLWDEPTDHLDPEAQARVLGYLKRYVAETGATALVATHRLEQMEAVGTHFGILKEGRLVLSGPRAEVLEAAAPRVRVAFAASPAAGAIASLAARLGLAGESPDPLSAVFSGPSLEARVPELVKALVLDGQAVRAVEPLRPTLGEVYGKAMVP